MKKVLAIMLVVFMLSLLSSMIVFAEEADLTVYVAEDTYVYQEQSDTVQGEWFLSIARSEGKHRRIFLKFDVMGITDMEIESVKLELIESGMAGEADVGFSVYKSSDDWDEATLTWDTMPFIAMSEVYGTRPKGMMEDQEIISVEIDPLLFADGDGYYSLVLIGGDEEYSDDSSYGAKGEEGAAKLIFTFVAAVEEEEDDVVIAPSPDTNDAGMIPIVGVALLSGISGVLILKRKRK